MILASSARDSGINFSTSRSFNSNYGSALSNLLKNGGQVISLSLKVRLGVL